jgi:hypothetical protein
VKDLSEDSTDVPKLVGVVKDLTFQSVCNLCVKLVWVSGETCRNTWIVGREMNSAPVCGVIVNGRPSVRRLLNVL